MEHISIKLSEADVIGFEDHINSNFPGYEISETLISDSIVLPPERQPSESFKEYINRIPRHPGLAPNTYEIVVAGIGAISTVIGAVIGYFSRRAEGKIVISGSSGRKIEVPSNTSKEDLEKYVEMAKELDNPRIEIG
jgi:hypothetical protein